MQIHLTTLNAKSEPEPELVSEFDRELSKWDAEAIEWAFAAHRRQSPYFPALSEILTLLKDWKRGKDEQRAIREKLDERFAVEEGRKQGLIPDFTDVLKQMAALCDKMTMPDCVRKLREFEARGGVQAHSPSPVLAQHMSREQMAARRDKELAEIEHYASIGRQQDGIYS